MHKNLYQLIHYVFQHVVQKNIHLIKNVTNALINVQNVITLINVLHVQEEWY